MKYKYYVVAVSTKSDDEREILKTNSKEEAIKEAKEEDFTNRRDGNDETVEIRMYEEDIFLFIYNYMPDRYKSHIYKI